MPREMIVTTLFVLSCFVMGLADPLPLYAVDAPRQGLIPSPSGQVMLIRNTLVAVNHANITGNYTVLRDLASARFRQQNKAADFAIAFAKLREQKFDLSPILVTEPKLIQQPTVDRLHGRLQLVGYFPTRPQEVQFALTFQRIEAGWMIDDISVVIAPVHATRTPVVQRP